MDIERELLSRLDSMEKHLSVVEEELVRYRQERFFKSVAITLLIVLPLIGLGFLVPNFLRKAAQQVAPQSLRPALQQVLPVELDNDIPPATPARPTTTVPAVPIGTTTKATSTATSTEDQPI